MKNKEIQDLVDSYNALLGKDFFILGAFPPQNKIGIVESTIWDSVSTIIFRYKKSDGSGGTTHTGLDYSKYSLELPDVIEYLRGDNIILRNNGIMNNTHMLDLLDEIEEILRLKRFLEL